MEEAKKTNRDTLKEYMKHKRVDATRCARASLPNIHATASGRELQRIEDHVEDQAITSCIRWMEYAHRDVELAEYFGILRHAGFPSRLVTKTLRFLDII